MRPIASARPGDTYTYVCGKRFTHIITNSDEVPEIEKDVVQKLLHVAYSHAVTNNRQLLYALVGSRCWYYKDKELSTVIFNVRKNRPAWAKGIIENFKM